VNRLLKQFAQMQKLVKQMGPCRKRVSSNLRKGEGASLLPVVTSTEVN